MEGFLNAFDPKRNGVADAFDPHQNGAAEAFDPEKNGFLNAMDPNRNGFALNFSREGVNQQDTIIKGMFSTNKEDKKEGYQAMIGGGGAAQDKIFDHPIGKPNNYDPVYNPDPRLPDAPKKPMTTSSTTTYLIIGGAAVLLFVLYKK
jgi:hypothetical protein